MSKAESRRIRVFHVPALVGNHGPCLAQLERGMGIDSTSIAEMPHPFGFHADQSLLRPGESPVTMEFRRLLWFFRMLFTADVVHYNWGRTFFPDLRPRPSALEQGLPRMFSRLYRLYGRLMSSVELRAMRWRGVRIVVTFQGDDARQADRCRERGAWRAADAMPNDEWTAAEDQWRRRVISRFDQYAVAMFALNPDLLRVLPPRARFLPYLHWGCAGVSGTTNQYRGEMVIAHSPSVRARKGTDSIVAAVDELRADGLPVRLRLIEGVSHADCVEAMSGASVFVDQLLYGWYGGAAVEAMSMGLPTVARIDQADLCFLPPEMARDLPVVDASVETVKERLSQLFRMGPKGREEIGKASRAFVERWHDPGRVAREVVGAYGIIRPDDANGPISR